MSTRLRASLIEIGQTISTWPQLASAVAQGGGAAADVVRRVLLGVPIQSGRYYVDLDCLIPAQPSGEAEVVERTTRVTPPPLTPARMVSMVDCPNSGWCAPPRPELLNHIIGAAARAPSGGNCQPWKWLAHADALYLFHDAARSRSLLDFEDGGAMVALGAALENAVLAAHHQGIAVRVDECPIPGEAKIVARLTLGAQVDGAEPAICDELYPMIGLRRTNRRLSRRTRIALADLATLARVAETVPGAKIQWLTEDEHLADCAAILGAGDRIRLLTEELSRHLMSEIRWTPAEAAATRDGISTEELGLASADVAALRMCRDWSTLSLVRDWRGGAHFERIARRPSVPREPSGC